MRKARVTEFDDMIKVYSRLYYQSKRKENNQQLFTEGEVNSDGYLASREANCSVSISIDPSLVKTKLSQANIYESFWKYKIQKNFKRI